MKTLSPGAVRIRPNESGAALIVVLLLLIIVTLLGLAAMRGAILQERMAASTAGRAAAFQVAEAGLRQAEIIVRDGNIKITNTGCANGLCQMPMPNTDPAWMANGFWTRGSGYRSGSVVETSFGDVTPKFVIEDFGQSTNNSAQKCVDLSKGCITSTVQNVYRITSYASMPSGAEVIVQSLYRR